MVDNNRRGVIKKISVSSYKAPGPDSLRLEIWKHVTEEILEWIRVIFDLCLRKGEFSVLWKCANLVLIPKGGGQDIDPTAIPKLRPICLLNKIAKAFERILAERISHWQAEHPGSSLSKRQFGFRKGRSIIDALLFLKKITQRAIRRGEYAFVVSHDIRNAFNSIPWRLIHDELKRKNFPPYIRRLIDSYLSDRFIQFIGSDGSLHTRAMEAGVPQGSVLGPVLWNIAFDGVLDLANEEEQCEIVCYADDTLIMVTGQDLSHTRLRADVFVTRVVNYINRLGLDVATNKTEAILFHSKSRRVIPVEVLIGEIPIAIQPSIKYLGVMVDSNWKFGEHIRFIKEKANRVMQALNHLMPNLRGPDERRRRLYAGVVTSIMLYGAPVWGEALINNRMAGRLVSIERTLAQRVISAYRTVSYNAALLLARLPPVRLMATMRKKIFERIASHKKNNTLTKDILGTIKEEEHFRMREKWREILEQPNTPGEFTKLAIVPRLEAWMSRDFGGISSDTGDDGTRLFREIPLPYRSKG